MSMRAVSVSLTVFAFASGVVAACSSFGDASETPSGDDATAPYVPDASAGESSTTGDGANACVPEPMGPTDAGAEDARCEPNGLEVNLAFSNEHCGFCGHRCTAENSCSNSACTGQAVTTIDGTVVVHKASTPTELYFLTNNPGCFTGHVRKTELGKTGHSDVLVEALPGCLTNIMVRGDDLYYLHAGYGIRRTPLGSPVAESPPIVPDSDAFAFTTTSAALFVLAKSYTEISRRQLDGTGAKTIYQDVDNPIRTLGSDATSAWWTTEPVEAGVGGATLWGLPPGASTVVKRAANLTSIRNFALDDDYIYLASDTGEVSRLTKAGATAAEPVTFIGAENHFPRGMAVVDDYVYVAVGYAGASGPVEIYRAKKCGGPARLVARDMMTFDAMIAAAGSLYFSGGSSLRRFAPTKP